MPSETFNGRGINFISKAGKTNFSYTMRTESGAGGDKDESDPENIVFGGGGQGAHYVWGTINNSEFGGVNSIDRLRVNVGDFGIELALWSADADVSLGDITTTPGRFATGSTGGFIGDNPITEDHFGTVQYHIGGAGHDGSGSAGGAGGGSATAIADGTDFAGAAQDTAGTNGKGGGGQHLGTAGTYSPAIVTISYDLLPTTAHSCNGIGPGIGIGL